MAGIIEMLTASPEIYRGKFFTASTAASSTGGAVPVSGSATSSTEPPVGVKALLTMYNSASRTSGTGKNTILIPLYIKIRVTTVGASGTSSKFIVGIDTEDRSGSATSLATQMTAVQTRAGSNASGAVAATTSKATIWSGNITMSAATSTWRKIGVVDFRPSTQSFRAGDECLISFNDAVSTSLNVPTLQIMKQGSVMAPVFLEPDTCLTVQSVIPAQTGASFYEFQLAWCEIKNDSVA